jgi:diguanylate cyclase (GGDEF)-like protein
LVLAGRDAGQIVPLAERENLIGRAPNAKLRLNDHGISRRHAIVLHRGDDFVIQDLGSSNGTLVNGSRVEEIVLRDGDRIQLGPGTILKFTFHDALDDEFQGNLLAAAQRDGLTGVYNKRYLLDALEIELAYARRTEKPLALLLVDVDHFKRINDNLGRLAGDQVLTYLARSIGHTLRKEDILARAGGEEFAVACRDQNEAAAKRLAERLRRSIEQNPFEYKNARLLVTISIGIAEMGEEASTPEALLAAADKALHAAKSLGRNRVATCGEIAHADLDVMPTLRVPKFKA